jgi:Zn-dependent protease with chaperone function
MFELLGLCVTLTSLLVLDSVLTAVCACLWSFTRRAARDWPAEARARATFVLRVFPAAASLLLVATLLLPAYLAHEPRTTEEELGLILPCLSALCAAGIIAAAWRLLSTRRATNRLLKDWVANARPVRLHGCPLPAYRLRHNFPVVAVVGVLRPRLFVADAVFEILSDEELAAAVAHELGHVRGRDNFKRALMRACRDVLIFKPRSLDLDRHWARASEAAADEHAAGQGGAAALDLASALVKIARHAPAGARPAMPAGAYMLDHSAGDLDGRVRSLIQLAEAPCGRHRAVVWSRRLEWVGLLGLLVLAVAAGLYSSAVHSSTHHFIELAVGILS